MTRNRKSASLEELREIVLLAGKSGQLTHFVEELTEFFDANEIILILRAAKEAGLIRG